MSATDAPIFRRKPNGRVCYNPTTGRAIRSAGAGESCGCGMCGGADHPDRLKLVLQGYELSLLGVTFNSNCSPSEYLTPTASLDGTFYLEKNSRGGGPCDYYARIVPCAWALEASGYRYAYFISAAIRQFVLRDDDSWIPFGPPRPASGVVVQLEIRVEPYADNVTREDPDGLSNAEVFVGFHVTPFNADGSLPAAFAGPLTFGPNYAMVACGPTYSRLPIKTQGTNTVTAVDADGDLPAFVNTGSACPPSDIVGPPGDGLPPYDPGSTSYSGSPGGTPSGSGSPSGPSSSNGSSTTSSTTPSGSAPPSSSTPPSSSVPPSGGGGGDPGGGGGGSPSGGGSSSAASPCLTCDTHRILEHANGTIAWSNVTYANGGTSVGPFGSAGGVTLAGINDSGSTQTAVYTNANGSLVGTYKCGPGLWSFGFALLIEGGYYDVFIQDQPGTSLGATVDIAAAQAEGRVTADFQGADGYYSTDIGSQIAGTLAISVNNTCEL